MAYKLLRYDAEKNTSLVKECSGICNLNNLLRTLQDLSDRHGEGYNYYIVWEGDYRGNEKTSN